MNQKHFFIRTIFGTFVTYDTYRERLTHGDNADTFAKVLLFYDESVGWLLKSSIWDACTSIILNGSTSKDSVQPLQLVEKDHFYYLKRGNLFLTCGSDGSATFDATDAKAWERIELVQADNPIAKWSPSSPLGGTQLSLSGLQARLGSKLGSIDLRVNVFDGTRSSGRPVVVWIHNEASTDYDWCCNLEITQYVSAFVFVSSWQRQEFVDRFPLPAEKCFVIRNAVSQNRIITSRNWNFQEKDRVITCAYTSAPYRGLDVLLNAWESLGTERMRLHVWSSKRLWGPGWEDTSEDLDLFARLQDQANVFYHGVESNASIRRSLEGIDFLLYPSTFKETSCISVIEAMSAGCRVLTSSIGALPETTAGFARVHPFVADRKLHSRLLVESLESEFACPWDGDERRCLVQQEYVQSTYNWTSRVVAWQNLIKKVTVEALQTFG